MHRFYHPQLPLIPGACSLAGEEAEHAVRVLRLQRDDKVLLLNGQGVVATARVVNAIRHQLDVEVCDVDQVPPPRCPLTLFQCIAKPRSMELIVQKATELGARGIQPVLSERVVSKLDADDASRKADKWQRIALEAMKQSGAPWLPEVRTPRTLGELAGTRAPRTEWFFGSLRETARWLRDWTTGWTSSLPEAVGLWIGPEGDFSDAELALLEQSGAQPFTMGSNVLRSETAAICGLTILSYELALVERSKASQ